MKFIRLIGVYENFFHLFSENQVKHLGQDIEFLNFKPGDIYDHLTHYMVNEVIGNSTIKINFYLLISLLVSQTISTDCEILEKYY
jgi:hypothetical protein